MILTAISPRLATKARGGNGNLVAAGGVFRGEYRLVQGVPSTTRTR